MAGSVIKIQEYINALAAGPPFSAGFYPDDDDVKIHLSGVSPLCAPLALRRGLNPELSAVSVKPFTFEPVLLYKRYLRRGYDKHPGIDN